MKEIKFVEDNRGDWYADLPDYPGPKADCEMVFGADSMLLMLAEGKDNVTLAISDIEDEIPNAVELKLLREGGSEGGGYYYFAEGEIEIWLCDVTKFVMGYIPSIIYFTVINETN
ncbi:hypothetical protein F1C16_05260 [Hymenobacter sp. NBH84]|uniref:DUF6717 family protein n=1 Tax=Hymenobacter sp. NBH84 TaxID=2596915 RepID=UPI00162990AF|nr:DUF6717 family protein [Hymenobacter sp. NBH84]QNE39004.1 hypothetical protein F1C16_05260 [Hymenobacter sp. NBH84]